MSETIDAVDKVLTDDVLELSTAGDASTEGGDRSAMAGLSMFTRLLDRFDLFGSRGSL